MGAVEDRTNNKKAPDAMFENARQRAAAKALTLRNSIEARLHLIVVWWLVLAGLASALRIAFSPVHDGQALTAMVTPYVLLVGAPAASLFLALRWFRDGARQPQPAIRLARIGRWRAVAPGAARTHPLYGAEGIMVSLLVGMLLNVPVRAAEYLAALPAIGGSVPPWLTVLRTMMTIDVVLLTSLYTIAFVAALRLVPLFPRLLAAIWVMDLAMQLLTARMVASTAGLPDQVAAALHGLLDGNVKKVLISIGLWLPYLLLSKRVNVTYRSRLPA